MGKVKIKGLDQLTDDAASSLAVFHNASLTITGFSG